MGFAVIPVMLFDGLFWLANLQSNQVKRTPQESINEFIIQKLNPLLVVDFKLISAFFFFFYFFFFLLIITLNNYIYNTTKTKQKKKTKNKKKNDTLTRDINRVKQN